MKLARSLTRSSIEHKSRRESIVKIANLIVQFEMACLPCHQRKGKQA